MPSLTHIHDVSLLTKDRALALVQACVRQLEEAMSIPDIIRTITHVDAVIAVTAKLKAAQEIRRLALRIRVDAEIALGRLASELPEGRRGPQGPNSPLSKTKVLNDMGVHRARAAIATRLSKLPLKKIEKIVESVPIRSGITGVMQAAGLAKRWANPDKLNVDIAFLANEAIEMLERCIEGVTVPHEGTVAEMRSRFGVLTSHRK